VLTSAGVRGTKLLKNPENKKKKWSNTFAMYLKVAIPHQGLK
jgi:hypothetical protein